jgi:hypothetical protein
MTNHELLKHAERCRNLSENCRDRAIAFKLRDLADYYLQLAEASKSPARTHDEEAHRRSTNTKEVEERSSPCRATRGLRTSL